MRELCFIAAITLGKPGEQCEVPRINSAFAAQGPADAVMRQPQVDAEAERILKKVGETYKDVSEYEFFADQTLTPSGKDTTATTHAPMRIAFKAPDKYRLEGTIPEGFLDLDHNADFPEEVVMVHDGSALWFYLPKSNLYYSIPGDALAADREGSAHTPAATDSIFMQKYRDAADFVEGAKLLREEEIEIAGTKTECYIVSVPKKAYTWWVDKKTFRVLRETSPYGETDFTTIKLNEPLPDSLFNFSPPADARKLAAKDF